MQLTCPNGHAAVIREDPKSDGRLGQCDTCGWSAPFIVARETADYQPDAERELGHNDDARTKQLPPPAARRRADRDDER